MIASADRGAARVPIQLGKTGRRLLGMGSPGDVQVPPGARPLQALEDLADFLRQSNLRADEGAHHELGRRLLR
jgi:hypothetical protein